jgi:hypothetical protein
MDIQKTAKEIYDREEITFKFVGGFLISENIIVVVLLSTGFSTEERLTYIFELKNNKWEYFASPRLEYLMTNLSDFLPAKKKFLIEVEVSTPPGDLKPDEAIQDFIRLQGNESFTLRLAGEN